jgi:hypothetical protein
LAEPVAELGAIDAPRLKLPGDPIERDAPGREALVLDHPRDARALRVRLEAAIDKCRGHADVAMRFPRHVLRDVDVRGMSPQRLDIGLRDRP